MINSSDPLPAATAVSPRRCYVLCIAVLAVAVIAGLVTTAALWPDMWLTSLKTADSRLMLLLNFDGSPVADRFFYRYSHQATWIPLVAVVVVCTFGRWKAPWRDKLALALIIFATVTITDQLTSGIIKPLVGRPRPSHDALLAPMLHFVHNYHGGRFGFVSGHAANICCITALLWHMFRSREMRLTLLLYALLMCYSRIYLGVHYPGDILCGAAIGIGAAWAVVRLFPARLFPAYDRVPWGIIIVWVSTMLVITIIP